MESHVSFRWVASGADRRLARLDARVRRRIARGRHGGSTGPAPTSSTTKSEKPRIALIMKSLANEFFKTMADGARKHQSQHASEYELIVNGIKDEHDLKHRSIWSRRWSPSESTQS